MLRSIEVQPPFLNAFFFFSLSCFGALAEQVIPPLVCVRRGCVLRACVLRVFGKKKLFV